MPLAAVGLEVVTWWHSGSGCIACVQHAAHEGRSGASLFPVPAVHELAASEIPKAYLFRGTKETTAQEVAKMLGLGLVQYKRPAGMPGPSGSPGLGRFLLPYSECDYTLESIIDDLQVLCQQGLHMLQELVSCC